MKIQFKPKDPFQEEMNSIIVCEKFKNQNEYKDIALIP